MSTLAPQIRHDNQRALMDEVRWIRGLIERLTSAEDHHADPVVDSPAEPAPALDLVCARFALSSFERKILVLCAAPELDGGFATALARVHGDPERAHPTFGLALAAFDDAHWSALAPSGGLRLWSLVELGAGGLSTARLSIDEWLLHVLAGTGGLDARLVPLLEPLSPADPITPSQGRALDGVLAAWAAPHADHGYQAVALGGRSPAAKRTAFAAICRRLGWQAYAIAAADVPHGAVDCAALARIWEREAMLSPAGLLIDFDDADDPALRSNVARFVGRLRTPVAVASRDGHQAGRRPALVVRVGKPTRSEQRVLWSQALGGTDDDVRRVVDPVLAQFDLDSSVIAATAGDAEPDLWEACRIATRTDLDGLAERLDTSATFDDLVLPDDPGDLLRDIAAQVRNRTRVYDDWQMAGPTSRGLGISALFAGPSGTGKTLAAEVLANSLALDLYRIDLSQVVNKYIGETEKNLRRVFDAADGGGVVLLFDEADALFGKRSEVRDSHDRYANLEVSYLLARMESYRGLAILTTNKREALDPAFMRRLRFVVPFPFPDADQRARMWQRAFPPRTPTRGLDAARLARLSVAGGTIRNIALHAAFVAAERGEPVGMGHLRRAAVVECAKLDRPCGEAEIGAWA